MKFIARHKLAVVLGLIVLAGLAWAVWSARRNAARRLDEPRLDAARKLWEEKGPKDYRLRYTILRSGADKPDTYEVQVIGGKPGRAWVNDLEEPAARLHHYGMDRLFDYLEQFLEIEKKDATKKALHFADFDSADGRLIRYQRHVSGGKEGVEIEVLGLE